ncbi:MAG: B12-binding domain-containing protein [Gemmobacter sp.]
MHQTIASSFDLRRHGPDAPDDRFGALAGQVIALLRIRDEKAMPLDDARLSRLADRLIAASLAHHADAVNALVVALRREGVDGDVLTDNVMPLAARELGEAWVDDRLSFVEVSLAMTRIQRLLRSTLVDAPQDGGLASILFILPEGEQHTLGGLICARQLRRAGYSVCLAIGETRSRIAEMLRERTYDAAFVSVATQERLESARELVTWMNTVAAGGLPVVVGGAVLCTADRSMADRVRAMTGARFASNDFQWVLDALHLSPAHVQRADSA